MPEYEKPKLPKHALFLRDRPLFRWISTGDLQQTPFYAHTQPTPTTIKLGALLGTHPQRQSRLAPPFPPAQRRAARRREGSQICLPSINATYGIEMLTLVSAITIILLLSLILGMIKTQCCTGKVAPTDGKSLPLNVLWPVLPGNDLKSRGRKWPPERSIPTRHNGG